MYTDWSDSMKTTLSDGEWKLMDCLWARAPMTIMELTGALREGTGWSKHTVITMLARLEAKGAVHHEEGPRAKRYFADLAREDAAETETKTFLDKVYGGSLGVMMSAMVGSRALTQEDIDELSAILERAKEDGA